MVSYDQDQTRHELHTTDHPTEEKGRQRQPTLEIITPPYRVDLLEEIASDEFDFIQHSVYLCIMLCTGDFDRINVDCNYYESKSRDGDTFVKVSCELDGIASDLMISDAAQTSTPQNASTIVVI
jgi:hypothetical protein